jgi:phosphoethanolamine N-methyltransferase
MDTHYLDSNQYTPQGIDAYQSIWGTGFVSPGGAQSARNFIAELDLKPNSLVLDVGCGLGGSAFLMATEFGVRVEGLDLSQNMLKLARARCADLGLESKVALQYGDILEISVHDRYDVVYSRDAFLHIASKKQLFENLHSALRSGGTLFFTDYCCSPSPWSDEFSRYIEQYNYSLHTLAEYEDLLGQAGFVDIEVRDLSRMFIDTLRDDLALLSHRESESELTQAWQKKLDRALDGEQKWGSFRARRAG